MALKHTLMIGALLITLVASGVVEGQDINTPSPRFRYKAVESSDSTRPYATPGVFDYDAQMFAPLEFRNDKEIEPQAGFFLSMDRLYLSTSRATVGDPQTASGIRPGSQYIWGNRYTGGWFSDEDEGWGLSYQQSNGIYFTAGQDQLVSNPMLVDMSVATVQINRMFRQMLSQGGYFEPYFGVRYMNISDNTLEDTTQVLNAATVFNRFKQNTTNDAFGVQAGGRYNRQRGRWRTTFDGAIATTYNQQRYFSTDITNAGTGAQGISETYLSDQSFVPIIQGEYEVNYNISRDIALKFGIQTIYAWNGIARANTLTTNLNPNSVFGSSTSATGFFDESHLSAGFLFGVQWKR
jgi:hypothetical protein